MKTVLCMALALSFEGSAVAQEPTAPANPAPGSTPPASVAPAVPAVQNPAPSVAPPNCSQPKIPQRFSIAREDLEYLEKQTRAYGECVTKYVRERQEQAQKYGDLAKAEADAGNAAAQEVNAFYAQVKALEDKQKPKGTQAAIGN